jgi:hypothetical protein
MSKNVKIVVAAACFIVAASIFYFTVLGGSGGSLSSGDQKMWFKCFNEKCNAAYSLTPDEFAKLQGDNPTMMMMGQMQAFQCQKCNQKTAYIATKCENEKCDEVFIMQMGMVPGQANQDFPDRCPKCGYSAIEQMGKEKK